MCGLCAVICVMYYKHNIVFSLVPETPKKMVMKFLDKGDDYECVYDYTL